MPISLRRAITYAFYWQHPLSAALALPLALGFCVWVSRQLSPLTSMPGNNYWAAIGAITAGCAGVGYVMLRLMRYGLARWRAGLAKSAPTWSWALADGARCATTCLLVVLLFLAPLLGRQGHPLVILGYTSPTASFVLGTLATFFGLALACPAWALVQPPRRIMPYVPARPDLGP